MWWQFKTCPSEQIIWSSNHAPITSNMYDISDLRFGWLSVRSELDQPMREACWRTDCQFPNVYCGYAAQSSDFKPPAVSAVSVCRGMKPRPLCHTQWCWLFIENVLIIYLLWTLEYRGWILIFGLTVPLTQSFSNLGLWTTSPEPTTGLQELPSVPEVDLVKYHVLDNKMYKLYATLSASQTM